MISPPIPPSLSRLGSRPFSFYPAIGNVRHNQWVYRRATWSEILVVNSRGGEELWVPRQFVGEVSAVDDPVVILGLTRELEYRHGVVTPVERRLIQMPAAVGASRGPSPVSPADHQRPRPAPVVGIRLESPRRKRRLQWIGGTLAFLILVYVLLTNALRRW
jgi:hypothetical protein